MAAVPPMASTRQVIAGLAAAAKTMVNQECHRTH